MRSPPVLYWVGVGFCLFRGGLATQVSVSSGEATTAALRLEEMTAALEGRQRELESLRDAQKAREQERRQDEDDHQKVAVRPPHLLSTGPPFSGVGSIDRSLPSQLGLSTTLKSEPNN